MLSKERYAWRWMALLLLSALLLNAGWARAALVSQLAGSPCDAWLLDQAKAPVAQFYGSVSSKPIVACVAEPALGLSVSHGRTSFAPWLPAVILLGREGANPDVAAHEWMHAELAGRVGVLTRTYGLPNWFDEGLAMQVDLRAEYDLPALERMLAAGNANEISLASIDAPRGFFAADSSRGRLHYAFARCVVGRWLESEPADLKPALWLHHHWLRTFDAAPYQAAAEFCLQGPG